MALDEGRSIEDLLLAVGAGDKAALNQLYRREAGRMLAVAQRILKRRTLAEEALQEAFVLVWRHAARFDPAKGSGATWLYTVLRNRALSTLREEGRLAPAEDAADLEQADEAETPEQTVARLSDAEALKHCLERLDVRRRSAIALAYVDGLSHAELAGRLGMPLGTIKSWLRRSLMTLKECLQ